MRTNEEIIARIKEIKGRDLFGFETNDLIIRLDRESAKPFLKEDADLSEWKPAPRDRESLIAEMLDYMPFAWGKAKDCRGISASRSLSHFSAWVWLAGDDLGDLLDYQHYGKDKLRLICDRYGFDADQWDDGIRVNCSSELEEA